MLACEQSPGCYLYIYEKSKTHDTKFCRKKADTAKIVTERKADISDTDHDSEDKVNFYLKVGSDPNTETVEPENVNLLVDCVATKHINDESKFVFFENFNPNDHYIELADGSRTNNVAMKKGTAKLYLQDTDGNMHD